MDMLLRKKRRNKPLQKRPEISKRIYALDKSQEKTEISILLKKKVQKSLSGSQG